MTRLEQLTKIKHELFLLQRISGLLAARVQPDENLSGLALAIDIITAESNRISLECEELGYKPPEEPCALSAPLPEPESDTGDTTESTGGTSTS